MRFETARVESEWASPNLNPLLKLILQDAADYSLNALQWNVTIVCIKRTPQENDALYLNDGTHLDGVHVEWRGGDIRTWDSPHMSDPDALTAYVNKKYQYDPRRPTKFVAMVEGTGPGSSGPHIHFQVHPRTVVL